MANLPSDTLTINTTENADPVGTQDFSCGFTFTVSATTSITGIRFYATRAITNALGRIWSGGGSTVVASTSTGALTAGWNLLPVTATLTTGVTYAVGVVQGPTASTVYYTATTGIASQTFGPVVTPSSSGLFRYGDGLLATGYPNTASANTWFGMDLVTGAAGSNGSVTAVRATATGLAPIPTVSGTTVGNATVSAVQATATALAVAPDVRGSAIFTGGGPATATAQAYAPTVVGQRMATVTAVVATATALASVPTVSASGNATVAAATAAATGQAGIPDVAASTDIIGGGPATATATAHAPTVTASGSATISAVTASATGSASTPTILATVSATILAARAEAEALAGLPTITGSTVADGTVTAVAATATAGAHAPSHVGVPGEAINITIIAGPVYHSWDAAAPVHGWTAEKPTGNQWSGDKPVKGWTPGPITK